jgi:hypothetical protein
MRLRFLGGFECGEVGGRTVLQHVAGRLPRFVANQLEQFQIPGVSPARLRMRVPCRCFQSMQGLERFLRGWRFHHAGPSDDAAPEVRNLQPVRFALGSHAGFATNDGAERDHSRDGDEVRRALHSFGNVSDPGCYRFWEQSDVKRRDWDEAVGQRLRLGPFLSAAIRKAPTRATDRTDRRRAECLRGIAVGAQNFVPLRFHHSLEAVVIA